MIDEKVIDKLIERLINRIEEANIYILKKMGKSIKKIGALSPIEIKNVESVLKTNDTYNDIMQKISKITKLNIKDIKEIFEEIAKENQKFTKKFYDYKKTKFIPFDENTNLKKKVETYSNEVINKYLDYSNKLGYSFKDGFGEIMFWTLLKTYNELVNYGVYCSQQGNEYFKKQMSKRLRQLAQSNLKIRDEENNKNFKFDYILRTEMQSSLRNMTNDLQEYFGEEYGADGIEISVHAHPAPDHAEVQGRQFTKEEFRKFQNDQDAIDYTGKLFTSEHDGHDRRSIGEYNCYHYVFYVSLDINKPKYTDEQLKKIIDDNNKGFEFDGEHYTLYEGTQLQNRLENKIQEEQNVKMIAEIMQDEDMINNSRKKIAELSYKYKQLSDVSGLPTKMERMSVSGYKRVATNQN